MKPARFCHLSCSLLCLLFSLPAVATSRDQIVELIVGGQKALADHNSVEAETDYISALKLAESGGDYIAAAAIHNYIGEIYEGAAKYQQALGRYETALKILDARTTGDYAASITANPSLPRLAAKSYVSSSGPPVSVDLYRGEIDIHQLFTSPAYTVILQAMLLLNAGNMYLNQSQYGPAEALYQRASALTSGTDPTLHRKILVNLAWSSIRRNSDDADQRLGEAMATLPGSPPPVEFRRAILAVGVRLREQKNYLQSIARIQQAIVLYKAASDSKGYGRALAQLGTTYLQAGDVTRAKESYLSALQINEQLDDYETRWHAEAGLAKCYDLEDDPREAFKHYTAYLDTVGWIASDFTTDQGQISFLEQHDDIFQDYARLAMRTASDPANSEAARKAIERVRAKGLEALLISREDNRNVRAAGHLSDTYVMHGEERYFSAEQTAHGVYAANQAAPGVAVRLGATGAPSSPPVAPPAVVFLEYFVTEDGTAIFVRDVQGHVFFAKADLGAEQLQDLVVEYRHALNTQGLRGGIEAVSGREVVNASSPDAGDRSVAQLSDILYRALVLPIAQKLPSDSQATIVIVPHRALWILPFAALQPSGGQYFGDQHVLTYAASQDVWTLTATRQRSFDSKNLQAWIAGNPKMPSSATSCGATFSFNPLPGAEKEAHAISALFSPRSAQVFTGSQADRLRLDAWNSDFTILHFATHGFACLTDPLDSFLVLSQLEPTEIAVDPVERKVSHVGDPRLPVILDPDSGASSATVMKSQRLLNYPGILDGKTIISHLRLHADLVTLSACQTGLGKMLGQGSIGLTRAFMAAGARSVLASLWRVDDDSTEDLMVNFYSDYLQSGNKGLALQSAMKKTRQRYPEPRYWAAFSLFGMAQ